METRMGTGRVSLESQRAALRLAGTEKISKANSLPLAARVSISNEIGTVLINGIISQVHADIILGKRHKCVGSGGRAGLPLPPCAFPRSLGLRDGEERGSLQPYLN